MSDESAMDAVYGLVGTGVATQETVPTAFAIIGSRAGRGTRDGPTWRPRARSARTITPGIAPM